MNKTKNTNEKVSAPETRTQPDVKDVQAALDRQRDYTRKLHGEVQEIIANREKHHPSCKPSDKDLVWHCNQCGENEPASDIEAELERVRVYDVIAVHEIGNRPLPAAPQPAKAAQGFSEREQAYHAYVISLLNRGEYLSYIEIGAALLHQRNEARAELERVRAALDYEKANAKKLWTAQQEAEQQRDGLLAALKDIETRSSYALIRLDKTNNDIQMDYIKQKASSAIASAEGEGK